MTQRTVPYEFLVVFVPIFDGEIWVTNKPGWVPQDKKDTRPVFYKSEFPDLLKKSETELRAIYKSKQVFPGAKVKHEEPRLF
jgi:hypothetical protein